MCVCVRACVRACVCVCVRMRMRVRMRVRVCLLTGMCACVAYLYAHVCE